MKNQKYTLLAAGFMFFGLLSCNNNSSTEAATNYETVETAPAATNTEVLPPLPTEDVTSVQPLPSGPISSPLINSGLATAPAVIANPQAAASPQAVASPQAIASTPVATKVAKGMNPAHGQPGHDCTIAVGAPLKKSVAAAAPAPVQATTVQSLPAEASQAVAPVPNFAPLNPKAKINPAHGQPGHDCSVAVGAALPGQ